MLRNKTLRAAVALGLLASGSVLAQDATQTFAKEAEYQDARLSPTGEYVAVTTPFEDRRALSLIKLSGSYDRSLIKFDVKEQPYNINWMGDKRLMVEKAKDFGLFGKLFGTGDVYAANADGSGQLQLFGYLPDNGNVRSRLKDQGSPTFMNAIPNTDGEALFYFTPWTYSSSRLSTSVYRVDTIHGSRSLVDSFDDDVVVDADNNGKLRFVTKKLMDGTEVVRYKAKPDGDWVSAPKLLTGQSLNVLYFDGDNNHAYALISDKGEPATLYRIDLSAGTREKMGGNAKYEPSGVMRAGRVGPPVVLTYTSGKPKVDYLDPSSPWAQLHAGLMKAFAGQMVSFVDVTKDENTVLLFVYSDRNPGTYYLFDRKTSKPTLLFQTREWIDPAKMAPTQAIEYKNRTGETLFAFLTVPQGRTGPRPLIVMPHGGPFGISDHWGFDDDAQFLASLGYSVLQVNYRGSGERGDAFEVAGYQKWGTAIQDDIADGVKQVIAQGLANKDKVCIYGISFGGYSAMMNPIRNPGMYKCSIAYAGVYDLEELFAAKDGNVNSKNYFQRTMGEGGTQAEQSPIKQIAKLDVPIFLIHGKSDQTAPFSQFGLAETALARAGKTYETLAKSDEGHGFYKEANRVEAYRRIKEFLLKYNPPN